MATPEKIDHIKDMVIKFTILYSVMYTGNNFFYAEQSPLRILLTSLIEVFGIIGVDYLWQKMSSKKKK
ncbi:MAG: hypothetical protein WCR36_11400 [Bacteroidaceae bacterium]